MRGKTEPLVGAVQLAACTDIISFATQAYQRRFVTSSQTDMLSHIREARNNSAAFYVVYDYIA